jgi:hypothetical protein
MYLVFTGKQRLAKNTLINALKKSALTLIEPVESDEHPLSFSLFPSIVSRLSSEAQNTFLDLKKFSLSDSIESAECALEMIASSLNS